MSGVTPALHEALSRAGCSAASTAEYAGNPLLMVFYTATESEAFVTHLAQLMFLQLVINKLIGYDLEMHTPI